MGRHGLTQGIDAARIQRACKREAAQVLCVCGGNIPVERLYRVGTTHKKVDKGLDEDGRFMAHDVGAENLFTRFVDDELDEAIIRGARFVSQCISFGRGGVVVDGRFYVMALFLCPFFSKPHMGRFRIGIGDGRYGVVLGPASFHGAYGKRGYGQ